MAKLIDADELKKKSFDLYDGRQNGTFMVVKESDIDEAPTVEAIEVVRCKDCKHRIYSYMTGGTYYCEFDCYYRNETARDANNPDYFCASGERKDGEDE